MNAHFAALAALVASLGLSALAAPAAHATPGAATRLATEVAREVVSAALGEGVAQAFAAALGADDSTARAMTLSETAYDRIADIVGEAISDAHFDLARAAATDALNTARTYSVVQAGGVLTQQMADQETLAKVNRVIDKAGVAETLIANAGLRGLPLFTMVQAAALSALDELKRLQGVPNQAANFDTMNDVALRSLAHIDAMARAFAEETHSRWPIYTVQTRTGSCHWLTGTCSKAWYRWCFDGPQGHECGYEYRDDHAIGNSNGQQDDIWLAYRSTFRQRSAQLAVALDEAFGAIGEVRRGLADRGDFPDRFDGWAQAIGDDFDTPRGWTDNTDLPRVVGDVNGDGLDDIVGFGNNAIRVYVANGDGTLSIAPSFEYSGTRYTYPTWDADNPRFIADFDGDGLDDIVGFANQGVVVSRSNGQGFEDPVVHLLQCGYDQGWRTALHVRDVADVNGDGRADVLCINDIGVYVGLNVNGNDLAELELAESTLTLNQGGWRVDEHPRMLADVNGDGMADLVGFGHAGVAVALSNGRTFDAPITGTSAFTHVEGWRVDQHLRLMADVNGDGNADIVGFGDVDTGVALGKGDGTFSPATLWIDGHGYQDGWRVDRHLRALGDLDGDGAADLMVNGDWPGVLVVYATRPVRP